MEPKGLLRYGHRSPLGRMFQQPTAEAPRYEFARINRRAQSLRKGKSCVLICWQRLTFCQRVHKYAGLADALSNRF
jgi:hypothetical protein